MRIDKFLKVSRLIKRRTVANEACGLDRVFINGKPVRPGDRVKIGDIIEVKLGERPLKAEVLAIDDHVSKAGASELYRIIEE